MLTKSGYWVSSRKDGSLKTYAWNGAIQKNREIQEKVREYLLGRECPDCLGAGYYDSNDEQETCELCKGAGEIPGKIGTDILIDLEVSSYDSYSPPQVEPHDDTQQANWLYDNSLDYLPQIERYREHKTQGQGDREGGVNSLDADMNYQDPFGD